MKKIFEAGRNSRLARAVLRRFARHDDGAAAVEFGIVVVPFLAILFAILETALVFLASQVLETAASDGARLIMTGQAQTQNLNAVTFKNFVCSRIFGLFDCQAGLKIDVRKYTAFTDANTSKPIDANKNLDTASFQFQPGVAGDIVVVRLVYEWPTFVRTFGLNVSDLANGKRALMATAAFRNEPYTTSP